MEYKAQGNALLVQGEKERAIQAYTKGIDLVEEGGDGLTAEDKACLPVLYCTRSMLHLQLCLVDEALQDAELAIEANPEYGRAYGRRAAVFLELFRNNDALADLTKAAELDPTLASQVEQSKKRATEKLTPGTKRLHFNCYLKRQIALQERYSCDYVLLLEMVDGEVVEDRVTYPSAEHQELTRQLIDNGTGTPFIIDTLSDFVSKETKAKVGDPTLLKSLIRDQLLREFGPDCAVFSTIMDGAPKGVLRPYSLQRSYEGGGYFMQTKCVPEGGLLLPGSPRWILSDDSAKKFAWVIPPAILGRQPNAVHNAQSLRAHRAAKFSHPRVSKCHGCGEAIDDPDPQECLCGEMYCCFQCYSENWSSHATECKKEIDQRIDEHESTVTYWGAVALGVLPLKDEPDFVAEWKKLGVTAENHGDVFRAECEFYLKHEWEDYVAEGFALVHNRANNHKHFEAPAETRSQQALTWKWVKKMWRPERNDSCARLMFKIVMCERLRQHLSMADCGVIPPPPQPVLVRQFREYLTSTEYQWNHTMEMPGADFHRLLREIEEMEKKA